MILILLIFLLGLSVDLFIHASYDSRLGFMGAVIGLPASILITVMYNDYVHRRDYMKSIQEDLYNVINGLQNLAAKAHRLSNAYHDVMASSDESAQELLMTLKSGHLLTNTSVLSDLLTNIESFYKKRKLSYWYLDDDSKRLNKINRDEYQVNDQLRPLIASLVVLDEESKKPSSRVDLDRVSNACLNVYRVAERVKKHFVSLNE